MAVLGHRNCDAAITIPLPAPIDLGASVTSDVLAVEVLILVIAELNPLVNDVATEVNTIETNLAPYENEAGLSQATLGALVALALIEVGGTLPNTVLTSPRWRRTSPPVSWAFPSPSRNQPRPHPASGAVGHHLHRQRVAERGAVGHLQVGTGRAAGLLQVNYNTTYYPETGAPVVRTTQGYIGLPTLLDVDGSPGLDMCVETEINLGSLTSLITSGSLPSLPSLSPLSSFNTATLLAELASLVSINPSSLKIQQQISKLPLASTVLPLDVTGVLPNIGNLGFGYSTKNSSAPQGYTTSIQIGSNPLIGMTDTTSNPGSSLTQTIALGSSLGLNFTWSPVPASMTTGFNLGSATGGGLALSFPNSVLSASD